MNDKKIAIILRDDLKTWQKLNVTAFLASAVTISYPELHGGHLLTASGGRYMPFIKQPVLVYKGEGLELMKRAFNRAKERELGIGIYPSQLFETMTEEDNLAVAFKKSDEEQDLVGLVFYGDRKKVNKALDGLKFHD